MLERIKPTHGTHPKEKMMTNLVFIMTLKYGLKNLPLRNLTVNISTMVLKIMQMLILSAHLWAVKSLSLLRMAEWTSDPGNRYSMENSMANVVKGC